MDFEAAEVDVERALMAERRAIAAEDAAESANFRTAREEASAEAASWRFVAVCIRNGTYPGVAEWVESQGGLWGFRVA